MSADAGVDPAMVMRYYGSKDKRFVAAAEFDLRFPDFATLDRTQVGRTLVRHFLDRWEDDALCRFVLRLPPVVEMSRDEVVEWIGPTIQRYLGLPEG